MGGVYRALACQIAAGARESHYSMAGLFHAAVEAAGWERIVGIHQVRSFEASQQLRVEVEHTDENGNGGDHSEGLQPGADPAQLGGSQV